MGAYCGAVHLTEPFAWVTDNALVVSDVSPDVDLSFFASFLKNINLNQFAKTSAQPSISQTIIKRVKILIPPLTEQQKIVTRLDVLSEKLRTLRELQQSQLEDMKKLEKAYLREAFRGELV